MQNHSLDIDTSQHSPVLISIVISKLSEDIKLQISRSVPISREWNVDELLAALLKEIESREMCSFMNYSRKDNKYGGSREPDNFTGAALFSGSNLSGQWFTIKCTYCQKNHKIHKCNLITDPRSRKSSVIWSHLGQISNFKKLIRDSS